ncbi:iron ABC transporter permease [Neobacillus notoginsengisoli]|uniref:Iron ABC transporter permease n=2 Tax=Neobacillus notoginsengisoli TaxID=1578198 RepID=A0A417YXL4_9BACI|nr:iron ABC transporter permease [Neobacillus notoginsengisoli]RHW42311.1 iron ABC transporter permease [Neobacillus notoginsengisoli]
MNRENLFFLKFIGGLLLMGASLFIGLRFGAAETSLNDIWMALSGSGKSDTATMLREIRFPREVAAVFVGGALAVAGAIMQGLTRNPLADPGLLGLTAGANTALALTIGLIPSIGYFGITIACFIGAAVGVLLVLGIGTAKRGGFSHLRIVLAGAAVSAFLYGVADGIGLYFKISKDVSLWTSGGLMGTSWSQLKVIVPFILIGLVIALFLSKQLTILSLSEEVAVGLGQKTQQIKILLVVAIVLLAGASVALVGNMAFIGLMIPHIVRIIVGTDYRYIIPMSGVVGAAFMVLADTIARTVNAPYETPVFAIVSMLGLPFFLFIIHKGGKLSL